MTEPGRRARLTGRALAGDDLTPADLRILGMIAEGMTDKQIGAAFGRSHETIRYHIRRIFDKLETRTRAQAVAIGFQRGILR